MRKYIVLSCLLLLLLSCLLSFVFDSYTHVAPEPVDWAYVKSTLVEGIREDDIDNMWTSRIDVTRYVKNDFNVLGSYRVWATFIFDYEGYCAAYSYKVSNYYAHYGWELYEKGVTAEGNTLTIHMELRKFIFRIPCSMTITCDERGNITYS